MKINYLHRDTSPVYIPSSDLSAKLQDSLLLHLPTWGSRRCLELNMTKDSS